MNKKQDPMGIILLAAGNASRFGGRKQFFEFDGEMLYKRMGNKIKQINNVVPVLVTQFEEMKEYSDGFYFVLNDKPDLGISYSIKLGVQRLFHEEKSVCGILFCVCDQPYISVQSLENLIEQYRRSDKGIACLSYQGEGGNPVIFSTDYQNMLCELVGDVGGKYIMKNHLDDVLYVEVEDKKELFDIDTKEDVKQLELYYYR